MFSIRTRQNLRVNDWLMIWVVSNWAIFEYYGGNHNSRAIPRMQDLGSRSKSPEFPTFPQDDYRLRNSETGT